MQTAMGAEKVKQASVQKQMQGMADNLSKMEAQLKSLQGLHAVVQQQRKALEVGWLVAPSVCCPPPFAWRIGASVDLSPSPSPNHRPTCVLQDENQALKAELSEHYAKRLTSAASPG